MLHELNILGMGACTPLGLTALATQTEMEAGTVRFFETHAMDRSGNPVRASILTLLERNSSRTERMTAMAATAMRECLQVIPAYDGHIPLLLALPEPESGSAFDLASLTSSLVRTALPTQLEIPQVPSIHEGRAGLFTALEEAARLLVSRQAALVLIGTIDSACDFDSLTRHAERGRSLGASNKDGTLAGEGAGFILVAAPGMFRSIEPRGRILGWSLAQEPYPITSRLPSRADGLTTAFRDLRVNPRLGGRRVDHVFSCQTGETFWAQEFARAYLRQAGLMPEPLVVSLVADSLGDLGAAAGTIQLGAALYKLCRERLTATGAAGRALIYGCSDAGRIGACIVELPVLKNASMPPC